VANLTGNRQKFDWFWLALLEWLFRSGREGGKDLEITPLLRDQEMKVSYIYWEGAVNATGRMADAPVEGRGYVELTGYSSCDGFHR
jgi:predicted secreted hydrolase